ncbi:hypothetical protein C8J57DRAFT_1298286 [Mycena rebaudengoi]|nr:hypothetical protein C8J57DRAFT_1298286 [Mycena rebaudengoi]
MANLEPAQAKLEFEAFLHSLGITNEDLQKRSDQMRQFLTSGDASSSRPLSQPSSASGSLSRASSSNALFARQISRTTSLLQSRRPEETVVPVIRQFDSMEMVLERQRLNRKQKRSKKRDQDLPTWTTLPQPDSPNPNDATPSNPTHSSPIHPSRDDEGNTSRVSAIPPAPVTPSKYYRAHTSYFEPGAPVVKTESPSPARTPSRPPQPALPYPYPYYYYSAAYAPQAHFLSLPFRSAQTPVKSCPSRNASSSPSPQKSPLPPSSPPATSPASSPARLVNIVSSPGPMVDDLDDDEDEDEKPLPYTLPPGPYSSERPHHSYAALIGQAVLSSRDHRLTLQEIYEWISTVYPHFKRGEQTWMNSIRHVLSTTAAFRKVSRERSKGRSHWAIFDEDLGCFKDGGYRKPGSTHRVGGGCTIANQVKETPGRGGFPLPSAASSIPPKTSDHPPFLLPALVHPRGKPSAQTQPASHHQTYYESCMPKAQTFVPSEILFPPLPKSSYRLIAASVSASSPKERPDDDGEDEVEAEDEDDRGASSPVESPSSPEMTSEAPHPSSSSSASVPALTPNRSSSSPIHPSEMDIDSDLPSSEDATCITFDTSVVITGDENAEPVGEDGETRVFSGTLLHPVQFWDEGSSNSVGDGHALQPGIELQGHATGDNEEDDEEDVPLMAISQANKLKQKSASPTLNRRKTAAAARTGHKSGKRKKAKAIKVQLSPVHTPLSHKGSGAGHTHYKSTPPALVYGAAKRTAIHRQEEDDEDEDEDDEDDGGPADPMRTPSRKRNTAGPSTYPVTPKKLLFPFDNSSSPFRTPGGGTLGASPFRTPSGSRGGIFDPHDPSRLLDEELSSLGAAGSGDSPAGLYGKRSLYTSPNPLEGSPGKWARWW